ncbi:MAG TPA: hypothetical protein VIR79_07430 [Nitrospira sp.]
MPAIGLPQLNAALGGLVVAVGAWLAWDQLSIAGAGLVMATVAAFLLWRGTSSGLVWAWSTLFLGIECFVWPVITMVQIRSSTAQPSDEQMGTILSAVLMGLFSAVFWIAFSYGLFKRAGREGVERHAAAVEKTSEAPPPITSSRRRNKR